MLKNKKVHFLFLLLVSTFFLGGCLQYKNKNINNNTNQNFNVEPGEVAIIESSIMVNKPLSNDQISSPLKISGRALSGIGNIYFRLKDLNGKILGENSAAIVVDLTDWGVYSGTLEFTAPGSPSGWLEVYSINTEAKAEENSIKVPVLFSQYQKPKIAVFFGNNKQDPDKKNCQTAYKIEREVEYSQQLIVRALEQLFGGVTKEEEAQGYFTNLPKKLVTINKIESKDGKIFIDFGEELADSAADKCTIQAIRVQITETLKLFSDTNEVIISINGKTEGVLQP